MTAYYDDLERQREAHRRIMELLERRKRPAPKTGEERLVAKVEKKRKRRGGQ